MTEKEIKFEETKKGVRKEKEKLQPKKMVYLGPTIEKIAVSNTIYNNGVAESLQVIARENPAIQALIVPIDKIVDTRKELAVASSVMSMCYKKALEYIEQKGE